MQINLIVLIIALCPLLTLMNTFSFIIDWLTLITSPSNAFCFFQTVNTNRVLVSIIKAGNMMPSEQLNGHKKQLPSLWQLSLPASLTILLPYSFYSSAVYIKEQKSTTNWVIIHHPQTGVKFLRMHSSEWLIQEQYFFIVNLVVSYFAYWAQLSIWHTLNSGFHWLLFTKALHVSLFTI